MNNDEIKIEEMADLFKTLSNGTRLNMIHLLKEPEKNFPPQIHIRPTDEFSGGICVGSIQEKINMGQSTTSQYLSLLQKTGILESKRIGQWTYYRRNETMIKKIETFIAESL